MTFKEEAGFEVIVDSGIHGGDYVIVPEMLAESGKPVIGKVIGPANIEHLPDGVRVKIKGTQKSRIFIVGRLEVHECPHKYTMKIVDE